MKPIVLLSCLGLALAGAAAADNPRALSNTPDNLFREHTRILTSERAERFRVLVTPNLVSRPAAVVTGVDAGTRYCRQFGKERLQMTNVARHADQDLESWALDFICR